MIAACLMLVSCQAYSSTMKMKTIYFSETSVYVYRLHGDISQKLELFAGISCSFARRFRFYIHSVVYAVLEVVAGRVLA
jgi:hypothetical protein